MAIVTINGENSPLWGLVFTLVLVGIMFGALFGLGKFQCYSKWSDSYETDHQMFKGCRVKINDKWIPVSNVRVN